MKKQNVKMRFPKVYKLFIKLINYRRSFFAYKYSKLDVSKYKYHLEKIYEKRTKEKLDWSNLRTYTEKMQWAKLNENSQLKSDLTDKYLVRKWIEEKIGIEYLIPLIDDWDKPEEIEFEKLPEKFVLKTNNGSGTNIVVKNKTLINKTKIIRQLNKWLKTKFAFTDGFQMHYEKIHPRIICEEYLEDSNGELNDYKFMCFSGKVHYCWVDVGRYSNHYRNVYDLEWKLQPWNQHFYENTPENIQKPDNFSEMIKIASLLSKDFSHVRVDLYNIDGKIYFGEMTFTNSSGFEQIIPQEYNYKLGELWDLPIK